MVLIVSGFLFIFWALDWRRDDWRARGLVVCSGLFSYFYFTYFVSFSGYFVACLLRAGDGVVIGSAFLGLIVFFFYKMSTSTFLMIFFYGRNLVVSEALVLVLDAVVCLSSERSLFSKYRFSEASPFFGLEAVLLSLAGEAKGESGWPKDCLFIPCRFY